MCCNFSVKDDRYRSRHIGGALSKGLKLISGLCEHQTFCIYCIYVAIRPKKKQS